MSLQGSDFVSRPLADADGESAGGGGRGTKFRIDSGALKAAAIALGSGFMAFAIEQVLARIAHPS